MTSFERELEPIFEKLKLGQRKYKSVGSTYGLIVMSSEIIYDLKKILSNIDSEKFIKFLKTYKKAKNFQNNLIASVSIKEMEVLARHGITDADWIIASRIKELTKKKMESRNEKIRTQAWARYINHLERGAQVFAMADSTAKRMLLVASEFAEGPYTDYGKAIFYYESAAELGSDYDSGYAHFSLWDIYWEGLNNKQKAKKHLTKAVDLNFPDALAAYGRAHLGNWLVREDERRGFELIRKSSVLGSGWGTELLADCYEMGLGTSKNGPKAFRLRSDLGENESAQNCFKLAEYHLDGNGTEVNVEEGTRLLKKAMQMGNGQAYHRMAQDLWFSDDYCANKSKQKERYQILKTASKLTDLFSLSLNELGKCYFFGDGVKQNFDEAKYWFERFLEVRIAPNIGSEADIYMEALAYSDPLAALDQI